MHLKTLRHLQPLAAVLACGALLAVWHACTAASTPGRVVGVIGATWLVALGVIPVCAAGGAQRAVRARAWVAAVSHVTVVCAIDATLLGERQRVWAAATPALPALGALAEPPAVLVATATILLSYLAVAEVDVAWGALGVANAGGFESDSAVPYATHDAAAFGRMLLVYATVCGALLMLGVRQYAVAATVRSLAQDLSRFDTDAARDLLACHGGTLPAALACAYADLVHLWVSVASYLPQTYVLSRRADDDADASPPTNLGTLGPRRASMPTLSLALDKTDDIEDATVVVVVTPYGSSEVDDDDDDGDGEAYMRGFTPSALRPSTSEPSHDCHQLSQARGRSTMSCLSDSLGRAADVYDEFAAVRPDPPPVPRPSLDLGSNHLEPAKRMSLLSMTFDLPVGLHHTAPAHFVQIHEALLAIALQQISETRGVVDGFLGCKLYASFNATRSARQHASAALSAVYAFVRERRESHVTTSACVTGAVVTGRGVCGVLGTPALRRPTIVGNLPAVLDKIDRTVAARRYGFLCSGSTYEETKFQFPIRIVLDVVFCKELGLGAMPAGNVLTPCSESPPSPRLARAHGPAAEGVEQRRYPTAFAGLRLPDALKVTPTGRDMRMGLPMTPITTLAKGAEEERDHRAPHTPRVFAMYELLFPTTDVRPETEDGEWMYSVAQNEAANREWEFYNEAGRRFLAQGAEPAMRYFAKYAGATAQQGFRDAIAQAAMVELEPQVMLLAAAPGEGRQPDTISRLAEVDAFNPPSAI